MWRTCTGKRNPKLGGGDVGGISTPKKLAGQRDRYNSLNQGGGGGEKVFSRLETSIKGGAFLGVLTYESESHRRGRKGGQLVFSELKG